MLQYILEFLHEFFVDKLSKKGYVVRAIFQAVADEKFQHFFGQIHITLQIAESHLRFNHPELSQMATGMGIFSSESGTKGIDIAQSQGVCFCLKLAAHRESGRAAEKIFSKVNRAVAAQFVKVKSGNGKHVTRPFAVAGGNNRGVDLKKISLLEKVVDRIG